MGKLFICLSLLYFTSNAYADDAREEITKMQKEKIALILEERRLSEELASLKENLQTLSQLHAEKKALIAHHQKKISESLPLLAHLGRINPWRLLVEPSSIPNTLRGITIVRGLTSSLKRHMQQLQAEINETSALAKDLEIKEQSYHGLLQDIELQQNRLALLQDEKIKNWSKHEKDRLAKEENIAVILEESRATISKTDQKVSAAAEAQGLPFRRLELPVVGKIIDDPVLENKFSPNGLGVVFETKKNAEVRASSKGKVVYRGSFRNQGEILILDHGEKVHTIFMGIDKINAQLGQNVYAGEKLGTMAGYGSEPPILYLELRQKGKAIDPRLYFAN